MALSTSTSGNIQSQAQTQSPQTATKPGGPTPAPGKSVQPGTANSLLTNQNISDGIPLRSSALSVVNLNPTTQTVASDSQQSPTKPQHHPNTAWLVVVAVIFVLAVIFFWHTTRSAKNTTH